MVTVLALRPTDYSRITDADQMTVRIANYVGDVSFAISGAVVAGKAGMDMVGVTMIGVITALGGGSIRDVCLGRLPLFWMVAARMGGP